MLNRLSLTVLLATLVAGCSAEPEVDRPGTWRATGVNDQNLRAMLVNPQDAYRGTGAMTARGDSGARAVTRLLTERRRPLLNATISRTGGTVENQADVGSGIPAAGTGGGSSMGGTQ